MTVCIFLKLSFVETSDGFNLLYTTNSLELENFPIRFEKELPKWLKGTLIRNGFGRFELGEHRMIHLFDAYAKLSSWKFKGDGRATFSTKFIDSSFYKKSMDSGDIAPFITFMGVEPPFGILESMKVLINGLDNMNVNVYPYSKVAGSSEMKDRGYYALTDFWKIYEFNATNLNTIGSVQAKIPGKPGKTALGFLSFISTAHPLPEIGKTSSLVFLTKLSLFPWEKHSVNLVRIKATDEREIVASIPVDQLPYMHSFSVTKNYAILFFSPIYINLVKIAKTVHPFEGLDWYGDRQTDVHVINLKTGAVISMKTENTFTMHHANAYENENGNIVLDLVTYDDPNFITSMTLDNFRDPKKRNNISFTAKFKRYYIDMKERNVTPYSFPNAKGQEFMTRFDFPKINEKYRAKKYCYMYGIAVKTDGKSLTKGAVVKKDVCEKGRDLAYDLDNVYFSETVFVPTPNSKDEDDGILLSSVLDANEKKSYLYIMDPKTMNVTNRAELPTIVPYTLHGGFFPEIH